MPDPTPIRLEFTYTYADIRAGTKLLSKRLLIARRIAGCILILSIAGLIFTFPRKSAPALDDLFPFRLIFVAIIWFLFFRNVRTSRKKWEKNNSHNLQILSLSDAGVIWDNPDSHLENKWSAYKRFAENRFVFVLYISDTLGVPLPKRIMTPDQIHQIRILLQSHINKTHAFPVLPPK